ncbi:TPA: hypothetical protein N0F65_006707 [Lagenidium giganteum]|uniref:AB hydrolase-1 domain-containing protein n=1 Tax=Lagenidium giganteum TaxID=4803 RepID=A0AAV2Z7I0_9STRA|nr:TPA: hypothetical protein N0F65_006707 [Lagenidium giganteum]
MISRGSRQRLLPAALQSAKAATAVATSKRIVSGNSQLNQFLRTTMQPALDRYTPTWWANAHVQVFLTFVVPQSRIKYRREMLVLRDGGQSSLDWVLTEQYRDCAHDLTHDSPIALVMHGLTGCSDSMRSICAEALRNGYRPVVYNKRGHGGMKLSTPKLQAFGCVNDLKEAIEVVQQRYPSAKIYGIGSSAGSGLLCSYLGETGGDSKIEAGVLISPGYNAHQLFVEGRINPMYDFLMTLNLKKFLLRHQSELKDVIHMPSVLKASSIREFDEHVYMKMHGYDSLLTYWEDNNPMRAIHNIQRPVLCINALDDPVCTKDQIPYETFESNPMAMLVTTGKGSHCAFYQGHVVLKSWANEAAMAYLNRVREYTGPYEHQANKTA